MSASTKLQTTTVSPERRQLEALREIGRAINAAWDLETTLNLITQQTAQVMGMDSCSIYLLEPGQETLVLKATTGLDREAIGRARLRVGEGITGWAVQAGQPLAVSDAASDPRFKYLPETGESRFTSLLAVPLINQGRVIGAINVQTAPFHHYTQDEIELLSLIGDLAAGALEKAMLYEDLRRRIAELSALAEVSRTVISDAYLEEVLGLVVELAASIMHARQCSLVLVDESGEELVIEAQPGRPATRRRQPRRAPGEGVTGHVMLTRQPLVVPDVRVDSRYRDPQRARRQGLCSLLAVPLSVRDRVIGAMRCYTAEPHDFTPQEIALFITLANQTALAIENAKLTVKAAVVQEMHHRIKNNLQTVAMLLRLQMSEAEAAGAGRIISESINRILSIAAVHEILSQEAVGLVNLRELTRRVADEVVRTMARPGQKVTVDVSGDPILLPSQPATAAALVVNELIQNAIEHGFGERAEGRIDISLQKGSHGWVVEVRDDGAGLPASFDQAFGRGLSPRARESSLGLEIITTLVRDDLGGEFTLRREDGVTVARVEVRQSAG